VKLDGLSRRFAKRQARKGPKAKRQARKRSKAKRQACKRLKAKRQAQVAWQTIRADDFKACEIEGERGNPAARHENIARKRI